MLNVQIGNEVVQNFSGAQTIKIESGDKLKVSVDEGSSYQVLIADNETDVILQVTDADGSTYDVVLEGLASLYTAGDVITQLLLDINGEEMLVSNMGDLLGALEATAAGATIGQNRSFADDNPNIDPNRSAADDSDQLRADSVLNTFDINGEANEAPVVSDVFLVQNEIQGIEGAGELNVITGQLVASDANFADTHTFSMVAGTLSVTDTNGVITLIEDSVTAVVNPDGTYTISGDFNDLSDGEIATVTFNYIATDSGGLSSTPATVSFTVTGTNDIPVVEAINLNDSTVWNLVTGGASLSTIESLAEMGISNDSSIPTDGSAIKFTIQTGENENVSFYWDFLDNDWGTYPWNDFSFVVVDGNLYTLEDSIDTDVNGNTTLTHLFTTSGLHTITFGVMNSGDTGYDSALNIEYVSGGTLVDVQTAGSVGSSYNSIIFYETSESEDILGVDDTQGEEPNSFIGVLSVADDDVMNTHEFRVVDGSLVIDDPAGAGIDAGDVTVSISFNEATQEWEYSIVGDFNELAAGETATVTFQYVADDMRGFDGTDGINESSISEPKTITVTVTGTNDQPVVQDVVMGEGDDVIYETHDENPWDNWTHVFPFYNPDQDGGIGLNDEYKNWIKGTLVATDDDVNDTHTFGLADMTASQNPNTQIVENVNYDTNGTKWGGTGKVDVAFTSSDINAEDVTVDAILLSRDNGSDNDTEFYLVGNFDALAAGETATVTFKYYATDSSSGSEEPNQSEYKTVSITVTGTNDQPVVQDVVMGEGDDVIYETHDENPWDNWTHVFPFYNPDQDGGIGLNDEYKNWIKGTLVATDDDVNDTHTFGLADMTASQNPNTQIVENVNYDTNGTKWGGTGKVDVAFTSSDINAEDVTVDAILLSRDNGSDNDTEFYLVGNFDALAAGETATVTFKYYATDSSSGSEEPNQSEYKTVSITVTGTNDQPVVQDVVMGEGDDVIYETHDENPWDNWTHVFPFYNPDQDGGIGLNDEYKNWIKGTLVATDDDVNDTHTFGLADMTASQNPNTQIVENVNYDTNGTKWGGTGKVDVAFTSSDINAEDVTVDAILLSRDNGSDNDTEFYLVGNFDALAAGETATVTFKYYATDSSSGSEEPNQSEYKTVSITVTGTNDQPVVQDVVMGEGDDVIYETHDENPWDNWTHVFPFYNPDQDGGIGLNDEYKNWIKGTLVATDDDVNDTHTFGLADMTASQNPNTQIVENVNYDTNGTKWGGTGKVDVAFTSSDINAEDVTVDAILLSRDNGSDNDTEFYLVGNFDALAAGETATVTFKYYATDSSSGSEEPNQSEYKTVSITVTGTNDQPVVQDVVMGVDDTIYESRDNKWYYNGQDDTQGDVTTAVFGKLVATDDDVNDTHVFNVRNYTASDYYGQGTGGPGPHGDQGDIRFDNVEFFQKGPHNGSDTVKMMIDSTDVNVSSLDVTKLVLMNNNAEDSEVDFKLEGNFNALGAGETATVTFAYVANDKQGFGQSGDENNEPSLSEEKLVTITITGTNDQPIVEDVTFDSVPVSYNVLALSEGAAMTVENLELVPQRFKMNFSLKLDNLDDGTIMQRGGETDAPTIEIHNNQLVFTMDTNTSNEYTLTYDINANQWYDISYVLKHGVLTLFVNGEEASSVVVDGMMPDLADTTMIIGGVDSIDGYIDNIDFRDAFSSLASYDFEDSSDTQGLLSGGAAITTITNTDLYSNQLGLDVADGTQPIFETHDETGDDAIDTNGDGNKTNDEIINSFTGTLSATDDDVNDTHTFFFGNYNLYSPVTVTAVVSGVVVQLSSTDTSVNLQEIASSLSSLTMNNNGASSADFTLSGDFSSLAANENVTITFKYFAVDDNGLSGFDGHNESSLSEMKTASVTITGTNDQPVISSLTYDINTPFVGDDYYETSTLPGGDTEGLNLLQGRLFVTDEDLSDTHDFVLKDMGGSLNNAKPEDVIDRYVLSMMSPEDRENPALVAQNIQAYKDAFLGKSEIEYIKSGIDYVEDDANRSDDGGQTYQIKVVVFSEDLKGGSQNGQESGGEGHTPHSGPHTEMPITLNSITLSNLIESAHDNPNSSHVDFALEGDFSALAAGETATIVFRYKAVDDSDNTYDIYDGQNEENESAEGFMTLTVTGTNDQPIVTTDKVYMVSEADADLLPSTEPETTVIREAFEVVDDDMSDTHIFSIESISNIEEVDTAGGYELFGPVTYIDGEGNLSAVFVQVKLPAGVSADDISISSIQVDGGEFEIIGKFDALSGELDGNPADILEIKLKYFADDQMGYDGTDGLNESSISETQWFTVKVEGTNDVASLSGDNTGNIHEDDTWTIDGQLTITDLDAGEEAYQSTVTYDSANSTNATALGVLLMDPATSKWSYYLDHANNAAEIQALGDEQVIEKFVVKSIDGTEQTVTITIQGTNDAPVIGTVVGDGTTITENNVIDGIVTDDTILADVNASDVDSSNLTYTITSGNSEGYFEINSDGEITLTQLGEQEVAASHVNDRTFDLGITVSDGTLEDTTTVTINVDDDFVDIPTIDLPASMDSGVSDSDNITNVALPTLNLGNIADDALNVRVINGSSVLQAQAVRSSVDGLWVIDNSAEGELSYNSVTNKWTFAPDNALADGTYTYTVIVNDDAGNEAYTTFSPLVIDTEGPAIDTSDIQTGVNETLSNVNLGEILATDTMSGNVTLSIPSSSEFILDSDGNLSLPSTLDYENQNSYSVVVTATDTAGNETTQTVTVNVNNITGIVSTLVGGVALQTFDGPNNENWDIDGNESGKKGGQTPNGILGWFSQDSDVASQTFNLDNSAGEEVTVNFDLSVYGGSGALDWDGGWEYHDFFVVNVIDSNGDEVYREIYHANGNETKDISFNMTVPEDGEFTVELQSEFTTNSGKYTEAWSIDNFEIVGTETKEVLTFDSTSQGEIDMAALLDQANDFENENGDSVSNPDSLDEINLSEGTHILSNLSIEDFIAMTDDDKTLKITADSDDGDKINLSNDWVAVGDGSPDADGYVAYTGAADTSLQLLIDDDIDVDIV